MGKKHLALAVALSLLVPPAQAAYLLVPANAQEIVSVLGPDARGLHLRADALPDLFTLTASRLEEDPKIFIVEQPYLSGRWQGGKAIIEYARDLSYTQVSIYDRNGNRQRIYSVRSKIEDRKPPPPPALLAEDLGVAPAEQAPPPSVNAPSDRPRRRHPVSPSEDAAPVPVPVSAPVSAPPVEVAPPPSVKAVPVVPTPISAPVIDEATAEGPHYEWDESRGAYVPVNVKVVAPASTTSGPKVTVTARAADVPETVAMTEAAPVPAPTPTPKSDDKTKSKKKSHKAVEAPAIAVAPVTAAVPAAVPAAPVRPPAPPQPPVDLHPSPETNSEWTAIADNLAQHVTTKPETDEAPNPNAASSAKPVPVKPAPTSAVANTANVETPVAPAPAAAPAIATTATAATAHKPRRGHGDVQSAPDQVIVASADAYDLPADEAKPNGSHKAKPSAAPSAVAHRRGTIAGTVDDNIAAAPVASSEHLETAAAHTHGSAPAVLDVPPALAGHGRSSPDEAAPGAPAGAPTPAADTSGGSLDSDAWVPKAGAPASQDVAIPAPKSKTKPASIDDLMQIASINQGAVPDEANVWVPKNTVLPPPDADIHEELTRVRNHKKVAAAPAVKINRDINNPEEGVLPANSFEKFAGPRYGRHREYERRLSFTKKSSSPIPPKSYDFIVDEVDRKKEFHNVYYYAHEAKGKPPRLVAVEKHERVTFMSNYDVEKEDKGKLTKY